MNSTTGHAFARDVLRMIAPFDNSAIDLRFEDLTKPEDWLYPKKAVLLIRDNHYSTIEVILDWIDRRQCPNVWRTEVDCPGFRILLFPHPRT